MRQPLRDKIKPKAGFSHFFRIGLNLLLPLIVFVLVSVSFVQLGYLVVILSKWRMFAVRPRHWFANIRANAVDIMVGVSFVTFMAHAPSESWRLVWAISYALWLVVIKPRPTMWWVSLQAMIGQLLALTAVYLAWGRAPLLGLVLITWAICYLAARHFLSTFDEPLNSLLAHLWGFFGAALTWVLGHWLLYYGNVAQPTLLLTIIGYGLLVLYYLHHNDKLSLLIQREILLIMTAMVLVVIVFSHWTNKV
jgi:hypothetical protein